MMYLTIIKITLHFWTLTNTEDYPETHEIPMGIFQLANKHLLWRRCMYPPY